MPHISSILREESTSVAIVCAPHLEQVKHLERWLAGGAMSGIPIETLVGMDGLRESATLGLTRIHASGASRSAKIEEEEAAVSWSAITYVSTGITLAAFIAATVAWIAQRTSMQRERLIKAAPESARADLVARALEFFQVDTGFLIETSRSRRTPPDWRTRGHSSMTTPLSFARPIVSLTP
jgi:hypothetical protein